jgi:hypothetical protein
MTAVTEPRTQPSRQSPLASGRLTLWMFGFCLVAAAITLNWPSTPSYDPWSWLIWGREILHGHLTIAGGSSWKPLPVLFTTVFALFGPAQPYLWLIVARAGALMASLMAAKLTARITLRLLAQGRPARWLAELSPWQRAAALAPVIFAAALALFGSGFTPTYPVPMMLGYSEGFTFGLALIAIERAWDGHHRQAFAIGLLPCLDRPELWFLWLPYGLWLAWRERRLFAMVLGGMALMLALWVVPQVLGGRSATGLVTHARHNHSIHSAVNSAFPFWTELSRVIQPLVLARVELAALALIAISAVLLVRDRRRLGGWRETLAANGPQATAALAGVVGFGWWLGISLETQIGFAGNTRYTIFGVLLVYIAGSSAYAWAAIALARLGGRLLARLPAPARLGAAGAAMALVFLFVPGWFARGLPSVGSIRLALRYQAQLREGYAGLIKHAGGPAKLLACGSVMTDNYEVTMLAWYLDVPIPRVQALPHTLETAQGPNVVVQAGGTSDTPDDLGPSPVQMGFWEEGWLAANGSHYTIRQQYPVTLFTDCSRHSAT